MRSVRKRKLLGGTFETVAVPLLLLMTFWALIYPASYWVGWWPGYEERMAAMGSQPHMPVPRDVSTKYKNLPDVKLTHILPAGVWSLCGALQLVPRLRLTRPRLHRLSGRVLLVCSALIAVGYILMEVHDIVEPWVAEEVTSNRHILDADPNDRHPASAGHTRPAGPRVLRATAAWFILTGGVAWWLALCHRFTAHSRWARRHMAAGGWVIVQRVLLGLMGAASQACGLAWDDGQRRELFGLAALVAIVLTLVGTEVVLRLEGGEPAAGAGVAKGAGKRHEGPRESIGVLASDPASRVKGE